MADADIAVVHEGWTVLLTIFTGFMAYFFKKRDDKIDKIDEKQGALELKIAENYATKDSLRNLFNETQNYQRESAARLEKRIDETKEQIKETKEEIKDTNKKIADLGMAILSKLDSKK